jgi:hypothetical protein
MTTQDINVDIGANNINVDVTPVNIDVSLPSNNIDISLANNTIAIDVVSNSINVEMVGSAGGLANPVPYITFDPTYTITGSETTGTTYWDSANHTLSTVLENGVILQHGQERHIYGKNRSGVTINNGDAVSIVANNGSFTAFGLTNATNAASAYAFVGLATQDIAPNDFGYVTSNGVVRDVNTHSYTEGMPLYVDAANPGKLTQTYPTPPNYIINVGIVEYKHSQRGRINVIPLIVPRLGDLSDVNGTPLTTDGQIPTWSQSNGYFDFTSNVGDFLKLDQSTPQTTTGTFSFPSVGIGTSSPRGIFDIFSQLTIGDPSNGSVDFAYGSGDYFNYGYTFDFYIYAYVEDNDGNRAYSVNAAYATGTDDGLNDKQYKVDLSWNGVTGATGYRVVVLNDDAFGAYGDYFFDTPYTNALISMGYDEVSAQSYINESPITVTPNAIGGNLYLSSANDIVTTGGIRFDGSLYKNDTKLAIWYADGNDFPYTNATVGIGQQPPTYGMLGVTGNWDQLVHYTSSYNAGDGGAAWLKFENASGDWVNIGAHHGSGNPWAMIWTNHTTVGRVKFYNESGLASIIYSSKICLLGNSSAVYGSSLNPAHYLYNTGQSYFADRVGINNAAASYLLDVTGEARFTTRVRTPEIKTDTSGATDLTITTGSAKTLVLATPVYNDYAVNITGARVPSAGNPSWTSYKGSEVLAFSASLQNTVYFTIQLPHSYKEGTDIGFHIHLAYPDNASGNSIWYFTYSWANIGSNFPAESNSGNVTVASPTTTDRHQVADIVATISGSGKTISSMLLCSISRLGNNGSDTYGNVIYLVGADIHHQIDTIGSRTATAK